MAEQTTQAFLDGLKTALTTTGYSFAFAAWSKAPSGDYGVYFCDGQDQFAADELSAAEIAERGYVDYFTRDASTAPKTAIEAALKTVGCKWWLNSIQFEKETGYIHYEWIWINDNGKV